MVPMIKRVTQLAAGFRGSPQLTLKTGRKGLVGGGRSANRCGRAHCGSRGGSGGAITGRSESPRFSGRGADSAREGGRPRARPVARSSMAKGRLLVAHTGLPLFLVRQLPLKYRHM